MAASNRVALDACPQLQRRCAPGFRAFRAVASGLGQGSAAVGMIESSALNVLVAAYPFL